MVTMERIEVLFLFFSFSFAKIYKEQELAAAWCCFLGNSLGGAVAHLGFGGVHSTSGTSSCQCQTNSVLSVLSLCQVQGIPPCHSEPRSRQPCQVLGGLSKNEILAPCPQPASSSCS